MAEHIQGLIVGKERSGYEVAIFKKNTETVAKYGSLGQCARLMLKSWLTDIRANLSR